MWWGGGHEACYTGAGKLPRFHSPAPHHIACMAAPWEPALLCLQARAAGVGAHQGQPASWRPTCVCSDGILGIDKLHQGIALALLAGPAGGVEWCRSARIAPALPSVRGSGRQPSQGMRTRWQQATNKQCCAYMPARRLRACPRCPLPSRQYTAEKSEICGKMSDLLPHLSSTRCTSDTSPYASKSCCKSASVAAGAGSPASVTVREGLRGRPGARQAAGSGRASQGWA